MFYFDVFFSNGSIFYRNFLSMVKREKSNYVIQSVSHALDVLDSLTEAGKEVGVTELATKLGLQKNNIFRILATLELRGYVEQNIETEGYALGVKALELGQSYLAQSDLIIRSLPYIKKLTEELGETASLAVLQGTRVQYPVSIASNKNVKISSRYGVSFDAKNISVGRLLLSSLSDSILDELFANDMQTKKQIIELRQSSSNIDECKSESEVVCISKLISNHRGVVGAIEVLIPKYRANIESAMPIINQISNDLSKALGVNATFKPKLQANIEKEHLASSSKSY